MKKNNGKRHFIISCIADCLLAVIILGVVGWCVSLIRELSIDVDNNTLAVYDEVSEKVDGVDTKIDDVDSKVDTVDDKVNKLKIELDKVKGEFMSHLDELYINDKRYEKDKAEIERYVSTLTTDTQFNSFRNEITEVVNKQKGEPYIPAVMHASIYRGKDLGNSYTSEQKLAVIEGTFEGLFIGDFWTINGTVYRIADMNYYFIENQSLVNHLVIVPDKEMYKTYMNETKTNTTGYVGSYMQLNGLGNAKRTILNDFGESNVLTHTVYVSSTMNYSAGYRNATPIECKVCLMDEIMVYGSHVRSSGRISSDKTQLAMFRLDKRNINYRGGFWLSDPVGETSFAMNLNGVANSSNANGEYGVRPYFCVG